MTKFEKAFTDALKERGFKPATPIRIGKGVSRRMFIRRGSQARMDLPAAVLSLYRE